MKSEPALLDDGFLVVFDLVAMVGLADVDFGTVAVVFVAVAVVFMADDDCVVEFVADVDFVAAGDNLFVA